MVKTVTVVISLMGNSESLSVPQLSVCHWGIAASTTLLHNACLLPHHSTPVQLQFPPNQGQLVIV